MSARDAITRLNRNRAGARMTLPSGAVFDTRPQPAATPSGHDSFPDRAPLDHVDIAPGGLVLETVTVPGTEERIQVCPFWPECLCMGGCEELPKPLPRWVWPAWFGLIALCLFAAWAAGHWGR